MAEPPAPGQAGPPAGTRPGPPRPGQPQADLHWLREAIELSRRCPPSESAFSVGAVLVSDAGTVIAAGHSRERDPKDHAEEVALARAAGDPLLAGATLYSSLEPCLARASRSRSCAELIVEAGIPRVVIAWLEPPLFAAGGGAGALRRAGVTVVEIPWLAGLARSVNAHLVGDETG
jgi:diaminohydroxyphosphoribosylaminopyrimidine deaminase / 5-amino-6-(5-phosphoribosylamino)uracil reductase